MGSPCLPVPIGVGTLYCIAIIHVYNKFYSFNFEFNLTLMDKEILFLSLFFL